MHGYVEKRGRRLGSSAPFLIVISTALELCSLATRGTQERSEWRDLSTTLEMTNGGARNDKKERDLSTTLEMTNGSARDDKGTQEEKETREPYPMRPPPILVTRLNGSN